MKINTYLFLILLSCAIPQLCAEEPTSKVVSFDEVQWGYLNPLRGDKSPGAADLWGDRTAQQATGMLVRFNKGFSSPPHIHNVSYRGVVIKGLLHNDDPKAEKMWLTPGSFWTQPAGEAHITAAQGQDNLAYVEIDNGPYLVNPASEAFDNGEKPVNVDQSNFSWVDSSDLKWIKLDNQEKNSKRPEVVFLWGTYEDNQLSGLMLKLPPQFNGNIVSQSEEFKAVVIQGTFNYGNSQELNPGSFIESNDSFSHSVTISGDSAILYIRTRGKFKLIQK